MIEKALEIVMRQAEKMCENEVQEQLDQLLLWSDRLPEHLKLKH